MSIPSMGMAMIWASTSYFRWMANFNRPVAAEREADSCPVALPIMGPPPRAGPGRFRCCCSSTSMDTGWSSMIHARRLSLPSAPTAEVTLDLNAGSMDVEL